MVFAAIDFVQAANLLAVTVGAHFEDAEMIGGSATPALDDLAAAMP
jgi:hypothetical protein